MEEIWKVYKVTKFHGGRIYEVSNLGNVKINGVFVDLSKFKDETGYIKIGTFNLHRAVAELFVTNPYNYNEVDHINSNKHDNRAVNLRWCTHQMNCNNVLTLKHQSESQKISQNKPSTKKKKSESQKIAQNRPETKKRQRESHLGQVAWNKGLKLK